MPQQYYPENGCDCRLVLVLSEAVLVLVIACFVEYEDEQRSIHLAIACIGPIIERRLKRSEIGADGQVRTIFHGGELDSTG